MSRAFSAVCLGLLILMTPATLRGDTTVTRLVGAQEIQLSLPDGFVDACAQDSQLNRLMKTSIPEDNRFLSCFLTERDWGTYTDGIPADVFSPYLVAQTYRPSSEHTITTEHFAELRELVRTQQQALMRQLDDQMESIVERGSEALTEFAGSEVAFSVGSVIPLGVYEEDPSRISFLMLTTNEITVAGQSTAYSQVLSNTILLLRGKLVYLYAYAAYGDGSDVERVKQLTEDWISTTREANRR